MMRARFPGALQQDANGESLRVLVENGVGTPGLVEKARTKLVDCRLPVRQRRQRLAVQRRPQRRARCRTAPTRAIAAGPEGRQAALGLPDVLGARPRTAARPSPT